MGYNYSSNEQLEWLRSLDRRASSACLILENEAGEALIVKANYKEHWTFPGGIIDIHENPMQAALRETLEEVGLKISEDTVEFAWVVSRSSRHTMTYQFVFKAPLAREDEAAIVLQTSEIDEDMFISKAEVQTDNRLYGQVIKNWANDRSGYVEQTFEVSA